MQSVFLMAAAAYCIRAAALWGKERGWLALENDFCCLRVAGDAASLENASVMDFKTLRCLQRILYKGDAM